MILIECVLATVKDCLLSALLVSKQCVVIILFIKFSNQFACLVIFIFVIIEIGVSDKLSWRSFLFFWLWQKIVFCSRFQLGSAEAGLISSCYDIAQCVCLLFVTYLGERGHKPQWLGWGFVTMGIGSIIFSLPRFIAPLYEIQTASQGKCNATVDSSCSDVGLRSFR